jgi:hypothetical protein
VQLLGAALRLPQIVGKLHLRPVLRRAPECLGQPQRHFRRDAGVAVENRRKSLARDAQALRRLGHAQIEGLKAVLPTDSLQSNSNSLQRNSNITAIEFQQLHQVAPVQYWYSV